jgi:hypothetical protein
MQFEQRYDCVVVTDDGVEWAADFRTEEQAEFVARACNAHEQLVAALKAVRHEVGGTHPFSIHSNLPAELVKRIDTALTAAGAA